MRIIDNRRKGLVFKDLCQGNVFIDAENNVMMKTVNVSDEYNAVSLKDGEVFNIPAEESIILLRNIKLVIED